MDRKIQVPIVLNTLKRNAKKFSATMMTDVADAESPFKVLVSCILSLRTKDATTEKAFRQLFKLAGTPKKMMALDIRKIRKAVYSVNYYKTKAARIKQISAELTEKYNGKVPDGIDELMKFKGVGRKTANIVLVYGFRKPGMPVDTHVHRISNRLGWVNTKTPEKTEVALRELVQKRYWMYVNDLFVQFGQNICKPVNPKCSSCPISKHCDYYNKNRKTDTKKI